VDNGYELEGTEEAKISLNNVDGEFCADNDPKTIYVHTTWAE